MRTKEEIQREWAETCAKLGQTYYHSDNLRVTMNNLKFELTQLAEEAEEAEEAKAESQ